MFGVAKTRRWMPILLAVAWLTGCVGGSSVPNGAAPTALFAAVRPSAQLYGNDWVYSAQPYGNNLAVYRRKGLTLTLKLTLSESISVPMGTVATPTGAWYVANSGGFDVLVYRSTKDGPKGPDSTLQDSGEVPVNVSVTPNQQLVAVSNATSIPSGTGSVSVYLNGTSQPSRILTYGNDLLVGSGVAIDPSGDCFWSFDDASNPSAPGSIVEFSQCSGAGTLIASGLTQAGGIVFDQSGNLYYIDEAHGIYKCQQTSNCKLFATGFVLPINLNFDAKQQHLWVADATGFIDAVSPKTGAIESQTISIDGDPYGVAPSPGS